MGVRILAPRPKRWACPNCDASHVTRRPDIHTPMHPCAGLRGLMAPYVEEGQSAKVYAVERADMLNGETQTLDDQGRPISFVVRERAEGNDVWAHAGVARITVVSNP